MSTSGRPWIATNPPSEAHLQDEHVIDVPAASPGGSLWPRLEVLRCQVIPHGWDSLSVSFTTAWRSKPPADPVEMLMPLRGPPRGRFTFQNPPFQPAWPARVLRVLTTRCVLREQARFCSRVRVNITGAKHVIREGWGQKSLCKGQRVPPGAATPHLEGQSVNCSRHKVFGRNLNWGQKV